jgi:hypothetical protein
MAAKSYEDMRAKLGQEEIDTSAANLQLAQSRRDQALLRKRTEAGSNLWSGTSGAGAADESVDQDAVSFLEAQGVPRKQAANLLTQGGISPNQKVRNSGFDMSAGLAKYGEYVSRYGSDDQSKAFLEALKLQNDRYALQNGMRMDKASGRIEFVEPVGLPAQGDKNIDLFIGGGTRKVDQRTAILYEFAQNQGPEVAKDFADKYIKNGTVPKDIVDKYKAQQSGAAGVAGDAEITPERLNSILTGLEIKSSGMMSPVELVGENAGKRPPLNREVKFNPQEAKVMAAMFRIGNAQVAEQSEESLSPFDRQVLSAFRARAKPPVALNEPSEVEKAAAAPAAIKVAAPPAPPAAVAVAPSPPPPAAPAPAAAAAPVPAAPVPAVKAASPAAAVVPTPVKAAAVTSASPSAAASAGLRPPAPPRIINVPPLSPNASQEEKQSQEAAKANAEAANSAERERFRIESEQYAKEINRPKDVDAAVEKAGGEDRIKEAQKREFAVKEKLDAAKATKYAALDVMKRVSDSPEAFGLLEYPGIIPAILTIASEGARIGDTSVTIAGLKDAIFKASPGITETALVDRTLANKRLAELQLMYAKKDMAGQGAISDKERALAEAIAGSVNDNPLALTRRMMLLVERSDFEQRELEAFRAWRKKNPASTKKDYFDFQESDELASVRKDYDKKMDSLYAQFFGKAEAKAAAKAASGATTGSAEANRARAQKEINRILGN